MCYFSGANDVAAKLTMTQARYELTLMEAAREGDADAITRLLQIAQPDIRRYAYLTCKAADSQDGTQETLWQQYQRIGTLRALRMLSGWLFATLRRECSQMAKLFGLRGGEIRDVGKDEYLLLMPVDELRDDVGRAIQSLPEHYRAIILLRDIEEKSIAEIAEITQQTRESVKGKLHRARMMLSEYLRDS
jgi:DNA-directed RNA polymerase specialized sigma24 family protein